MSQNRSSFVLLRMLAFTALSGDLPVYLNVFGERGVRELPPEIKGRTGRAFATVAMKSPHRLVRVPVQLGVRVGGGKKQVEAACVQRVYTIT